MNVNFIHYTQAPLFRIMYIYNLTLYTSFHSHCCKHKLCLCSFDFWFEEVNLHTWFMILLAVWKPILVCCSVYRSMMGKPEVFSAHNVFRTMPSEVLFCGQKPKQYFHHAHFKHVRKYKCCKACSLFFVSPSTLVKYGSSQEATESCWRTLHTAVWIHWSFKSNFNIYIIYLFKCGFLRLNKIFHDFPHFMGVESVVFHPRVAPWKFLKSQSTQCLCIHVVIINAHQINFCTLHKLQTLQIMVQNQLWTYIRPKQSRATFSLYYYRNKQCIKDDI